MFPFLIIIITHKNQGKNMKFCFSIILSKKIKIKIFMCVISHRKETYLLLSSFIN